MEVLLVQPLAIRSYCSDPTVGTRTPRILSTPTTRSATPNSQIATLLVLPTEIRLLIYAHLLLSPLHHLPAHMVPSGPLLHPAILRTCHLINDEAAPLLYSNIFTAHPTLLISLPHYTSPHRPLLAAHRITGIKHWRIRVRLDCDARFGKDAAAQAFSGADTLVVEAEQSMFRAAGYGVLLALEGVRRVKNAKVEGTVEPIVARWLERRMMSDEKDEEEGVGGMETGGAGVYEPWTHAGR